ncbi:hypothetical protein DSO57_1003813 [Entomophthora muscae]|uniref:Uncharacterized protein n=1 Tax=Entomophthora muscae TaxID=34485 RepID=A0ACC2UHU8_9FUNG|nr:hypothetical protein DSO57_1003813 [Entomophthora muscae]
MAQPIITRPLGTAPSASHCRPPPSPEMIRYSALSLANHTPRSPSPSSFRLPIQNLAVEAVILPSPLNSPPMIGQPPTQSRRHSGPISPISSAEPFLLKPTQKKLSNFFHFTL